ncbi:MAG: voltage-gated potassium channel [Pirellulaceae bacterium]|jgi:voltage-gated potassium channel
MRWLMSLLDFDDPIVSRLAKVCVVLVALTLFGTLGFVVVEGWPLIDGFFMTVITISTVGYSAPQELTTAGRFFTSFLIIACLFAMTSWTAALTSFIVENDLGGNFLRRRHRKMISQLTDHTIVCGSGLMAQAVIERLIRKRKHVVLLDDNESRIDELRKRYRKLLIVLGNATNELSLAEANVISASHVVACMEKEVDNLLVAITCKDLGTEVKVFARSNDVTIANRLRKAEVDQVISPMQLGGDRIADLILGNSG